MMLDFSDYKSRIEDRLRKNSNSTIVAAIPEEINRVIRFFSREEFWFNEALTSITLEVGVNDITTNTSFPTDFRFLDRKSGLTMIDNNIQYPLEKINPIEYKYYNLGQTGRPYQYAQIANQVLIYFAPDDTYDLQIQYYKKYAELVNDTDTNDFLENAEGLIINKVLANIYSEFRIDIEKAAAYDARATDEFTQLQKLRNRRQATGKITGENPRVSGFRFTHRNRR